MDASGDFYKFLYVFLALFTLVLALIVLRLFLHRVAHRDPIGSSSLPLPLLSPRPSPARAALELAAPVTALEKAHADQACPVCLDALRPGDAGRVLPCGHAFHDDCALAWLVKTNACPLCRQPPVAHPTYSYPPELSDDRRSDSHSALRALNDRLAELDEQIEERRRQQRAPDAPADRCVHIPCTAWVRSNR